MQIDTLWLVIIIVIVLAVIAGPVLLLRKHNKPFDFPKGYEERQQKRVKEQQKKDQNEDEDSGLF